MLMRKASHWIIAVVIAMTTPLVLAGGNNNENGKGGEGGDGGNATSVAGAAAAAGAIAGASSNSSGIGVGGSSKATGGNATASGGYSSAVGEGGNASGASANQSVSTSSRNVVLAGGNVGSPANDTCAANFSVFFGLINAPIAMDWCVAKEQVAVLLSLGLRDAALARLCQIKEIDATGICPTKAIQ